MLPVAPGALLSAEGEGDLEWAEFLNGVRATVRPSLRGGLVAREICALHLVRQSLYQAP